MFNKVKEIKKDKVNKEVVKGLSRLYLKNTPDYLDRIIRSSIRSIHKDINFKYLGYEYLTPKEDFDNQFSTTTTNNQVDISDSTLYKVKFIFSYNDELITRVISLPYVRDGGILTLSDTKYSVTPVLSEYVISSNGAEVFTRLMKDKLIIKKIERGIYKNGVRTPIPIIVSNIYKFATSANPAVPIALLLFVQYGFDEVFKKYFDTKVIMQDGEGPSEKLMKTHTIYKSLGRKPKNLRDNDYKPNDIWFAVPNDKVTKNLEIFINSLMSTFDLINVYSKYLLKERGKKREKMVWKIILGKVIFKNNFALDKLLTKMDEYLTVLDGYMDDVTLEKLRETNINVKNFYDLIEKLILDFDKLTSTAMSRSASLDTRYIDINYYILYEHIAGINKTFHGINKDFIAGKLTYDNIVKTFNKKFSTKMVFNLIKNGSTNLALVPVDSSTDNYFFKVTSTLEDQNRGQGVKRAKNNTFPQSTRTIHADDIILGSILYVSKKAPTPRLKINPYINIDLTSGRVLLSKVEERLVDKVNRMLQGKFLDNKFLDNIIETEDEIKL